MADPETVQEARHYLAAVAACGLDDNSAGDPELLTMFRLGRKMAEARIREHAETGGSEPGAEDCTHRTACGFCRARADQAEVIQGLLSRLKGGLEATLGRLETPDVALAPADYVSGAAGAVVQFAIDLANLVDRGRHILDEPDIARQLESDVRMALRRTLSHLEAAEEVTIRNGLGR